MSKIDENWKIIFLFWTNNEKSVIISATNHHGTRCAGEIAAVPNAVCAVGVAYGAKVAGEDLHLINNINECDKLTVINLMSKSLA